MNRHLREMLTELERFGRENDRGLTERGRRMLNITPDTGPFLNVLVRATAAGRVLEIGTSNGYSTLWLAEAASEIGGRVTTIESNVEKVHLAAGNFARAGREIEAVIDLIHEEAGAVLARLDTAAFDLIFLDANRGQYPGWWPDLQRLLRPGGLLVVDNATSHTAQLAPFVALVEATPAFTTSLVPLGNGEYLAVKETD